MAAHTRRLTELADEELMTLYMKNEDSAFEVLLTRYRKPLFGFLYRYLGRSDKAEDVFQEVFYEVIRAKDRYRPDARFTSWIFRIARNRAVDRLRRDSFREMDSLDAQVDPNELEGEVRLNMIPSDYPNPETIMQEREFEDALEDAMASLPPEQREVFWLKEKSGMTLSEIAVVTGVSQNTVKSRLRYAIEKLRLHLAGRGFES